MCFFKTSFFDESFQIIDIGAATHIHVYARGDGERSGIGWIFGKAVSYQISHGEGVTHYEALKIPSVAENVCQEESIACSRYAVEIHIGAHDCARSGFNGRMEGREVDVPELLIGDVGRIIITSTIGGAITREMLDGCKHVPRLANVGALEAFHLGACNG